MDWGWGAENARALIGIAAILTAAWAWGGFARFPWRLGFFALSLQFGLMVLLFTLPGLRGAILQVDKVFAALRDATLEGTAFVFGYIGGGPAPFPVENGALMFSLAFQALPLVMVVSALSAMLWHWRVLPLITSGFAMVFRGLLRISGAASLAVAANIFLGMVESPILIRPYLKAMTRSELFVVMTAGMATVAGTVLVIYGLLLAPIIPNAAGHVLAASIISGPAAILLAKLIVPEREEPTQAVDLARIAGPKYDSTMDALTTGVSEGLKLFLNIIAMLIVFVALVALANTLLSALPDVGGAALSVERLLGWVFQPVMWLIGTPWAESQTAGTLFGVKTALNEFLAYQALASAGEELSPRTYLILLYALCGFSNFGGLGIMLAGLTTMAPERRSDILSLGLKSLAAGALATLMTGAVVAALPTAVFGL